MMTSPSTASYESWTRPGFLVSTDPALLQLPVIHGYLARSYWAPNVPLETVTKAVENSFCLGLYAVPPAEEEQSSPAPVQVGFARWITDRSTFAYLSDVFVLESHAGKGLGRWLLSCAMSVAELQCCRSLMCKTREGTVGWYESLGWTRWEQSTGEKNIWVLQKKPGASAGSAGNADGASQ